MKEKFIQEMNDKMYWDTHREGYDHAQLEMWQIEYERKQYEEEERKKIAQLEANENLKDIVQHIKKKI